MSSPSLVVFEEDTEPTAESTLEQLNDSTSIADFKKQIENLQLSFAESEKERMRLQQLISSYIATTAVNASPATIAPTCSATKTAVSFPIANKSSLPLGSSSPLPVNTTTPINPNPIPLISRSNVTENTSSNLYWNPYLPGTFNSLLNTTAPSHLPYSYPSTSSVQMPYSHFATSTRLPPTSQPIPCHQQQPHHQSLRKLQELPEFSGLPEQWPVFSVAFKETSAAHCYTNLENLSRLQKALKGTAKQHVEALLIHPNSVSTIMSTLEFHFGRPEVLIRSQLAKVRAFPTIHESRPNEIINFSTVVSNLTAFLENACATPHLTNPTLLDELVGKLPLSKREEWAKHTIATMTLYPNVREFSNWLTQVATYVTIATEIKPHNSTNMPSLYEKRFKNLNTLCVVGEDCQQKVKCMFCKEEHHLYQCAKFKAKNTSERWNIVKQNHLCFCCLRSGHSVSQCPYRRECGILSCRKCHNRLLHDSDEKKKQIYPLISAGNQTAGRTVSVIKTTTNDLPSVNNNTTVNTIIKKQCPRKITLFKFLPVQLSGPNGTCNVIAFIDDGAKISLIEESLANTIGIKGASDLLSLKWIGDQTTSEISQHVNIEISGVQANARKFQMKNVRTIRKLLLPPQSLNLTEFRKQFNQIQDIPIVDYVDAVPQILIGIPHTSLVRPTELINFDEGFSVHNTKLGWTLFGSNEDNASHAVVSFVDCETDRTDDLHKLVEEYFAIENFASKPNKLIVSDFDKRAAETLKETTRRVPQTGQYETGLLWKYERMKFEDSYSMALKRLQLVERKMANNLEFSNWYRSKINDYLAKNYAKKLSPEEAAVSSDRTWYLPHFATCNINKGNKLRLIFDAAAQVHGMSLNSMLLKGPEEYQPKPLLSILFGFRQRQIGVCGDIRDMFLRVNIRKQDQDAQRFLWRDGNQSQPPEIYVMSAMIFGSKSSPCSAQFIKNLNASQYKDIHPRAVKAIVDCHYVDDFVDSFDTLDEAIAITKTVVKIHSYAGFELRNFLSNSPKLLDALNHESSHSPLQPNLKDICYSDLNTEKILGMFWDPKADEFCFALKFGRMPRAVLDGEIRPTKSQVLSLTMSIFDPFGFIANITIESKLLLQRLWKANVGWNEEIPDGIYGEWYEWYKRLDNLKEFRVSRCYHINLMKPCADVQLHIFVDASEVAFSAVGYWRIYIENTVKLVFIMGKTRCSPIRALSIPRLELEAAVLGVRVKEAIINGHEIKPTKTVFWSDSKTVIHWIRSDTRTYKQFVAHRVTEILDFSEVDNWRWVPGRQNPADYATRPRRDTGVSASSPWINGPSFLERPEEEWPRFPDNIAAHEKSDEKRSRSIFTISHTTSLLALDKYSSYFKLLRVMCWIQRAVIKFKYLVKKETNFDFACCKKQISVAEINSAESLLCRLVQKEAFPTEVKILLSKKVVPKNSSIYKLSPLMDENNLIRLGGRIDNAECLPFDAKRPIIMPKSHSVTKLLVKYYHEKFKHHNQEAIICAIRAKYWIPNVRRLVRTTKLSCQLCKNASAVPVPPLMGQLPVDRLTPFVRPFSYAGVDYFGPLQVSIGRRREKRWAAIFTCLATRAIHLELAKDLSTDAVIICLRNFINRRGVPVRIRSDCGTNFVGANKEQWLETEKTLENECTSRGIEWVFNVPGNPSAGGVWERMVRCVKRVLSFTLKERAPQLETLQGLLIEAENLVNSRPLTHIPVESSDAEPLTPNHFLLGCPNYVQTPAVNENICLRKQWHVLQQMKQTFWKRWVLEYLPMLTRRTKWHNPTSPMEVGDIVVVCDENESRGEWKRGRVIEVFPAPDGQVRSAVVQTPSGNLRRPVSKLAKLDLLTSESRR